MRAVRAGEHHENSVAADGGMLGVMSDEPFASRPRILLDCDPGHDDAMAIVVAARYADLVGHHHRGRQRSARTHHLQRPCDA